MVCYYLCACTVVQRLVTCVISRSPRLWIYSSSGVLLAEVPFLYKQVVAMGWSDQEHLLIALEDGRILAFDIHGKQVAGFNIFGDTAQLTIMEAHFWGNGLAVMGSDHQIHVVEGLAHMDASFTPRTYRYSNCSSLCFCAVVG